MSTTTKHCIESDLYEADFHAWCLEQSARLRERQRVGANDGLDYDNLAEEIESLARSDRKAIRSHAQVLLMHLLKWRYQPDKRSLSWRRSIAQARDEIEEQIIDSPSLKSYPSSIVDTVYLKAVRDATVETGLPEGAFPAVCPFSHNEVFDHAFLPDQV